MNKLAFIEQYALRIKTLYKEYAHLKRNFTHDTNQFVKEYPNDNLTFDLGQVYAHITDTEENLRRIDSLMTSLMTLMNELNARAAVSNAKTENAQ